MVLIEALFGSRRSERRRRDDVMAILGQIVPFQGSFCGVRVATEMSASSTHLYYIVSGLSVRVSKSPGLHHEMIQIGLLQTPCASLA